MKYKRFFLSAVVGVSLLSISVCEICAKAPTTAKIAYSSWRDGNMDIFLMNPDGSEEVQLTHDLRRMPVRNGLRRAKGLYFIPTETVRQETGTCI